LLHLQKQTQEDFQRLSQQVERREAEFERKKIGSERKLERQLRYEFELEKEKLIKELVGELAEEELIETKEQKMKAEMHEKLQNEISEELQKREKILNFSLFKKLEKEPKKVEETHEMEWRQKIKQEKKY
jgi:hypothetical protein